MLMLVLPLTAVTTHTQSDQYLANYFIKLSKQAYQYPVTQLISLS